MLKSVLSFFLLWFSASAHAEVVTCKSDASVAPLNLEVSVDMDKGKSTLRRVFPNGTGVTQGLDIHRRGHDGDSTKYSAGRDARVFLQIPSSSTATAKGTFTHAPQRLNAIPVDCEILGEIPAGPICPKNLDGALFQAMDTAETIDEIEFLLQCGANPNATNSKQCTPLMLAVDPECHSDNASGMINDTVGLVDLLLSNGAFADLQDHNGETALIKSVRQGVQNIYGSFIGAESDFNIQDNKGNTALMYAAFEGDHWIIQDILNGNPDRRLKNKRGKTAYQIASEQHDKETSDLVRIPDQTVTISGKEDGSCSPLSLDLSQGQTIEFILKATSKMFKMDARSLGLSLMADRGSIAKQILTLDRRGSFKFTCGIHGANKPSEGIISIR